jgi:CRISPR system Cascade subunit CasA
LPDDWLFALVSLQTFAGYGGKFRYGVCRLKSSVSARPGIGVLPPGGTGARFVRDVTLLIAGGRDEILQDIALKANGGLQLVWLPQWDGNRQLPFSDLDPLFIEICRRVRLLNGFSKLSAVITGSQAARISAEGINGNTGDPWTPVRVENAKAFSVVPGGLNYKIMTDLLITNLYKKAYLQELHRIDAEEGVMFIASSVCRDESNKGVQAGYHERAIPISKEVVRIFRDPTDALAAKANERVKQAGVIRGQVLRPALFSLLQKGPDSIAYGAKTTPIQAEPWLHRFEQRVDQTFFPDLWREAAAPQNEQAAIRLDWLRRMADAALELLDEAMRAVPQASMRRYRAKVRSRGLFFALLHEHFHDLKHEDVHDCTA